MNMGTTAEESNVFSVNTDLCTEMYDDDVDGRAVDLYKCLLCVASLNHPLTLDCHHTFCAPCIRDFHTGNTSAANNTNTTDPPIRQNDERNVVCPTCRQTSVRTWEELNVDLNSNGEDVTDGKVRVSNHKNSNTSIEGAQICDVCEFSSKTVESEIYCSKCSLNLCQACKEIHGNHILFKSHPVIHISNKYSVTLYCKRHTKQQSGYYCNECRTPCCVVCILQDHVGHSASLFMDAVTQKKERVKSVLNNLGPQLDKLDSRLQKISHYEELGSRNNNANYPTRLKLNRFHDESDILAEELEMLDEMPLIARKMPTGSNNSTPHDTPKRKRRFSIFDNDKKRSKDGGVGSRKISLFEGRRGKKFSDPLILERPQNLKSKGQTSALETISADRSTPLILTTPTSEEADEPAIFSLPSPPVPSPTSPTRTSKMGLKHSHYHQRTHSTGSTHSWHPFVRMGKSSPLLTRRSISATTTSTTSSEIIELEMKSNSSPQPKSAGVRPSASPPTLRQPEARLVPVSIKIDKAQVSSFATHVKTFRKLYDFAAKSLHMGHTKKVLDFYDLLATHIRSVADHEVQDIKALVREIHSDVEKAMAQMTPSASMGSVDLTSAETRKTSGASSDDSMSAEESRNTELSLLIKPELVWKTEKNKADQGDLFNRSGISFLPNGNIVAAEYDLSNANNNRLHIYDQSGKTVRVICEKQLCPLGVAVTSDGLIAVTDSKSKRVKIVTQTGEIVNEWGKGMFGWPHGIAVNSRGNFIVSDAFNDVISIHHSDGKLIRQFGSSGSGNTHFRNPYHIAVDRHDNIIVSDCGNNCIKAFNTNGEFLFTNRGVSASAIDGFDQKYRRLKAPRGVATDPKGNILVADDNSRVCMLDCRGKYVRNILTEDESVKFVEGLATNADGELALTECNPANMNAVKMFHVYTRDMDGPVHQPIIKSILP